MKCRRRYYLHAVCVGVMFLLGGAIAIEPKGETNELTLLGFMIASVAATLFGFISAPFLAKLFGEKRTVKSRLLRAAIYILYICIGIAVIFDAARCSKMCIDFVCSVILSGANRLFVAALIFAAALLPSIEKRGVLLKFSLLASIVTVLAIVVFFVFSLKELRVENIKLLSFPEIGRLSAQILKVFLRVFLPLYIYYIYVGMTVSEGKGGICAWGSGIGGAILCFAAANALLLFGASLTGELKFPYAAAIGSVSVGELFSRLDALSYIIYIGSSVVRLSVCSAVVSEFFVRIGEKSRKKSAVFSLLISVFLGVAI